MKLLFPQKTAAWIIVLICILLVTLGCLIAVFTLRLFNSAQQSPAANEKRQHFVLVAGTHADIGFLKQVYEGALSVSDEYDAVVELLAPQSQADDVSIQTWLEYGAAVGASGIIAYIDNEKDIVAFPEDVHGNIVPLITIGKDNPESTHASFIGANTYELGQVVARAVTGILPEEGSVLTVVNSSENNEFTNQLLASMQEALVAYPRITTGILETGFNKELSQDEIIRRKLMNTPETGVVVCLSLDDTLRVAQSVIDLNKTGQIKIIGFHESEKTLEYLQKNILSAVISLNPVQMGKTAMHELFRYRKEGYANGYILSDISVLTQESLSETR